MNNRVYPHPIIAREGWTILAVAFLAFLVSWWLDLGVITFLFFVFFVFALQFFRDPAREAPEDPKAVVSPVDGRICKVEKCPNPETGEDSVKVSIFMNVFSVHSQKAPVSGVVEKVTYTPGLFVNADLDKASTENERNAVTVRMEDGRRVTFIQVAGLVARRIICYTSIGDELKRGERYGFIRFGSRVDVYLPPDAEIVAGIGDKMTGVMSVIARLP
ncbi:phosphatidylserine decarboxylase [Sutterella sp.]|uniref:phosphatidylserine decarboxylase n=1 Tax=Sutterella sp. TaxID=1981025 RepID=UPI0026E02AE0|nr:phosphatidylserine decarboxylase [Sutterella sp.]MDO5532282.1 phosphatidylserine decarboxylase [Sutterella sp.]